MPPRPFAISILFFILLSAGFYEIYSKLRGSNSVYRIPSNEKWVGVIDMGANHGISLAGIIEGQDALITLDYNNPLFKQILQKMKTPTMDITEFELADFDNNKDGLLDIQDPIFPYLHAIILSPNGQGYTARSLTDAGIRGIKIHHISTHENHHVILSDGSTRTLYEINKPGATSIYKNNKGKTVTTIPETKQQSQGQLEKFF